MGLGLPAHCQHAGLREARKQHNDTGKLSLHFRADESGIISLEKGEAISEISEEYTVKVPVVPEGLSPELSKALENITWPDSFGESNGTEKVCILFFALAKHLLVRHVAIEADL